MVPRRDRFASFVAIDWSGAKGTKHPGIAVGHCELGQSPPDLVPPPSGRHWSRQAVADWILGLRDNVIIGLDFSFAPPFADAGAYLPGETTAALAKAFWAYVDNVCADDDLGAASFLEMQHRGHFYFGAADGPKRNYMRLRRCEAHYNATGGRKPSTVFDAIGAAQVAKASFAGMRLLHRLNTAVPVWPFDPLPKSGPVIVEIYTQIAARNAGVQKGRSKVRDATALDCAMAALGSEPHKPLNVYSDHATDALITAAWLRRKAADSLFWCPPGLSKEIAQTEGWTFGVI